MNCTLLDKMDITIDMLDRIFARIDAMGNDEARQADLKYQLRFIDLECDSEV